MIPDFFQYGGVEVVNSARTNTYIEAGYAPPRVSFGGCGCPELAHMLLGGQGSITDDEDQDAVYTTPFFDGAPWIDENHPDSLDFAGIIPLGITESEDGSITRGTVELLGGTSRLGRSICGPKRYTFSGLLVGATCCSIDYGLRWLRSVLLGTLQVGGGRACRGDSLEFLTCCPDCERKPGTIAASCTSAGALLALEDKPRTVCDCYEEYVRCVHDVGLESGPTVVERHGSGCGKCGGCPILEVEWTWISATPFDYGNRSTAFLRRELPPAQEACDPEWTKGAQAGDCDDITEDCGDLSVCEIEAPCAVIPPPPVPRVVSCICDDPLSVVTDAIHIGGAGDEIQVPCNSQLVPTITVNAGDQTLRNVTIRFYEDPQDRGCAQFRTEDGTGRPKGTCNACSTIHITTIPAGGSLVIDGELDVAKLICSGGVREPVNQLLYGPGGTPHSVPALQCSAYCVLLTADARYSEGATWSLSFTERSV